MIVKQMLMSTVKLRTELHGFIEEADETGYWFELARDAGLMHDQDADDMIDEASQLVAIFTASVRTAKARSKKP